MSSPRSSTDGYAALKSDAAERSRVASAIGRDIGDIPAVKNPARRAACERNLRPFCESYFAEFFPLAWSGDHLLLIAALERAILEGGQQAFACPRGFGKTTLALVATLWAILYAHRRFVVFVGAEKDAAIETLEKIKVALETNDELAADFPEVCHPIRKLERITNRCQGQTHRGEPTRIVWNADELQLPIIAGSAASGCIVQVAGITGRIRGRSHLLPDGTIVRPDLAVIDDPQTDESANSVTQSAQRERILSQSVLGLAGPKVRIAAIMPCTVIRRGDMVDAILDRKLHPEWRGARYAALKRWPDNLKLWDEYDAVRRESIRVHGDMRDANAFYLAHRTELEAGAVVQWPERFYDDELSGLQNAMNFHLASPSGFAAEYQQAPLGDRMAEDRGTLDVDGIAAKLGGLARGVVPQSSAWITAMIDVHNSVLFYVVTAWSEEFSGAVIDYGTWPRQSRAEFTLDDAAATLQKAAPGAGLEGAVYAGLAALVDEIIGREWTREDGSVARVSLCMIDANYGQLTALVYRFIRESRYAASLIPSHGRGFGAASAPVDAAKKKPGDRFGYGWRIPGDRGPHLVRHVIFDANRWKSHVHNRLAVPIGDKGSLVLWGTSAHAHTLFARHVTSEIRTRREHQGRTVDTWSLPPNRPDNHWLDGLVGCAVAASILGAVLAEMPGPMQPRRRRMTYEQLRAEAERQTADALRGTR